MLELLEKMEFYRFFPKPYSFYIGIIKLKLIIVVKFRMQMIYANIYKN